MLLHQKLPMPVSPNDSFPGIDAAASQKPLLSIIIVTYQSHDEISACLDSLPRDLCGSPVEIIVVDNASKDGTLDFVRSRYPHVIAVEAGANLGFGRANNLGYSHARGAFILFLNPDTIANREALENCLRRLQNEPEVGIISPKLVLGDWRNGFGLPPIHSERMGRVDTRLGTGSPVSTFSYLCRL